MRALVLSLLGMLVACASSAPDGGAAAAGGGGEGGVSTLPPTPVTVCNGHAELCDRAYTAVSFPGDHDAYATVAGLYLGADQTYPMTRQLDDGVRVLHLEVQPNPDDSNAPSLCHGACILGHERLVDGLAEIRAFVAAHPDELVTLLMETSNGSTGADVARAMNDAGLAPYARAHALGAAWPTLRAMLDDGERVVALLSSDAPAAEPWLLDRFAFTWETPWDNESLADFRRCDADRGTKGDAIYVVDNYLEDMAVASTAEAATTNTDPFLVDRQLLCQGAEMQLPNYVMVNFYEIGDVFHVVDVLNGFADAPPFDPSDFPPGEGGGGAGGGG